MILETILTVVSSQLGKSVMEGLFKWLAFKKFQRALIDLHEDMCLDCLENYIEKTGGSQEDVKKARKLMSKPARKEAKIRFSALFMAFARK